MLNVVVSQELQEVFGSILSVATKTDQNDSDQKEDTIDKNQEIFDKIIETIFHRVELRIKLEQISSSDEKLDKILDVEKRKVEQLESWTFQLSD